MYYTNDNIENDSEAEGKKTTMSEIIQRKLI